MSAWIVEKEHIDVLIKAALEGPADNYGDTIYLNGTRWDNFSWWVEDEKFTLTRENADEIGDMLWFENARSVGYRYSYAGRVPYYGEEIAAELEDREDQSLPGSPEWVNKYHYADPGFRPTVAEIIKTIGCYEYQSCEHDDWKGSSAETFCRELRDTALWKLPGLSQAPWGWDESLIQERQGQ